MMIFSDAAIEVEFSGESLERVYWIVLFSYLEDMAIKNYKQIGSCTKG